MVSVSRLIDMLNKPFLVNWANKLGLEGKDLKTYYKQTSSEGNEAHNQIELYLTKGIKFEGWEKLQKSLDGFEVIGVEKSIDNGYINGRIDLMLKKAGRIYVVDFKRNKRIYLKTKLQLSTYKYLANADYVCYINSEDLKLEILNINTEKYWLITRNLYRINKLLNELNEQL